MVEGPTARIIAERLDRSLKGKVIRQAFSRSKKVEAGLLAGERVKRVYAVGKNILIETRTYLLRIHLMMWGSVGIYTRDEQLHKPEKQVRLFLELDDLKVAVYNAPVIELDEKERLKKRIEENYGFDPLNSVWDRSAVLKAMEDNAELTVSQFLLSQKFIAGVGNIIRNEVLFRCRIHPETKLKDLSPREKGNLIDEVVNFTRATYLLKKQKRRWGEIMMVYRKKVCPRCGEKIKRYKPDDTKRLTFYCPRCQTEK